MTPPSSDPRESWKHELRSTPDCVPIERFDATLTPAERAHIARCTRCEAELALWEECRDATPSPDEGAAVQWIAAEIARRRVGPAPAPRWGRIWQHWREALRPRTMAAVAATCVVLLSGAYLLRDPEPPMGLETIGGDVYRSATLDVVGPIGDVTASPGTLHWTSGSGAARYEVEVRVVDQTLLWRGSARDPLVNLPASISARFAPGKTILWQVKALGDDGTVLADSGTRQFRVAVDAARTPRR